MPNNGTGRATPTRAYQQILGNMFNEQVRNGNARLPLRNTGINNQVPVSNIDKQPQTHATSSNLNIQEQMKINGQSMQAPFTIVSVPAIRPPRVTATPTVNTMINSHPRMSLGVTTAPTAFKPPVSQTNSLRDTSHKGIGSMEYDYNKQFFISSSLNNLQDQNTNPSITRPVLDHNNLATSSGNTRQNTLPSTQSTPTITQTYISAPHLPPQRLNLDNLFKDEDGHYDYKAMYIHVLAKLEAQEELTKPKTHKMNYGHVPPPILNLDNELRSTTYQLWKINWLDFFGKAGMHDSEGLQFLRDQSILDRTLKNLISVCETVSSAFELLDTQFGDKEAEMRITKTHICDNPVLTDNYDFEYQIEVVKKILHYITIFNRLFLPQGEDFYAFELNNSMMSWNPRAQQMTL